VVFGEEREKNIKEQRAYEIGSEKGSSEGDF